MKYFLIILLLSFGFAQNIFTDEEVVNLANKVNALQKSDSLKSIQIHTYEQLVDKLEHQSNIDSLIICGKNKQIELLYEREKFYKEKLELIRPNFWDNKYLWYLYGTGTIIISSWVVSNIK